jgi:hypothetical protein
LLIGDRAVAGDDGASVSVRVHEILGEGSGGEVALGSEGCGLPGREAPDVVIRVEALLVNDLLGQEEFLRSLAAPWGVTPSDQIAVVVVANLAHLIGTHHHGEALVLQRDPRVEP